jgi:hypothetical protein
MVAGRVDFNCNSFTSDCVGFLTGGSIPSWIKGASRMSLRRSLTDTPHRLAFRLPFYTFRGRATAHHRRHVPPPDRSHACRRPTTNPRTCIVPPARRRRSRDGARASRLGIQHAVSQHDGRGRDPRLDEPGVIPQPTRVVPRRRRYVHVCGVRAV